LKVIIVFASFVGNTETMAGYIRDTLLAAGHDVVCKDVIYAGLDEIHDYDVILLGSPTYEPKMVHDDMLEFYESLANLDLSGKKAAAFGPGDTAWPDFCTAVEMLEERLQKCGAEIIAAGHMVDGVVEDARDQTEGWARSLAI